MTSKTLQLLIVLQAIGLLVASHTARAENACGFDLVDGEITEQKYSGFHGHIKVSTPADPPPASGYPVVLYYHGWSTGLRPNLRIMQAVTQGKDYLLVGMSYRNKKFYEQLDRRNLRFELQRFDDILDELEQCRPINRDAVFVAGYSQGGYASSMLAEQRADRIAGVILLGSARRHAKMYLDDVKALAGKPIFMGVGEQDVPHHHYAVTSAKIYALMGATVTMETWPDTNHAQGWAWYVKDPERGINLRNWMDQVLDSAISFEPAKDLSSH